jgi:hypothetical protein
VIATVAADKRYISLSHTLLCSRCDRISRSISSRYLSWGSSQGKGSFDTTVWMSLAVQLLSTNSARAFAKPARRDMYWRVSATNLRCSEGTSPQSLEAPKKNPVCTWVINGRNCGCALATYCTVSASISERTFASRSTCSSANMRSRIPERPNSARLWLL